MWKEQCHLGKLLGAFRGYHLELYQPLLSTPNTPGTAMLHRIYVIRHGETVDFAQNFKGEIPSPTGNPADVELTKIGIEQSQQTVRELAAQTNFPVDVVYSSPAYQCLETLRPFVINADGKITHMVRVENGLRLVAAHPALEAS
jgi:hypothetical protein